MNADGRAKYRRWASRICFAVEAVLIGVILVSSFDVYLFEKKTNGLGSVVARERLIDKSTRLALEYGRYIIGKKEGLVFLPPPQAPNGLPSWQEKIERYLGQSAGVFVQNGSRLVYQSESRGIDLPVLDSVKAVLMEPEEMLQRGTWKTLGTSRVYRDGFSVDGDDYTFCLIHRDSIPQRWLVLLNADSSMLSFYRVLNEARSEVTNLDAAHVLSYDFLLNASRGILQRTGLRVLYQGREIFCSPGLDSSGTPYVRRYRGFEEHYYGSPRDESYIGRIWHDRISSSWALIGMEGLLAAVILIFYAVVRKLTEPESS